jgi:hypothetical protein
MGEGESTLSLNDQKQILNGDIIETINQFGVTEERLNQRRSILNVYLSQRGSTGSTAL